MIRRFVAYFIDWYLALILMNAVLLCAAFSLTGKVYAGALPLTFFPDNMQLILLMSLLLIEVALYVLIPRCLWRGQTLGKRLMRIRVVVKDGSDVGAVRLLFRDLVCIAIVEGCFSPISNFIRNYLMLFLDEGAIQLTVWFSWAAGFVSILIMIFNARRMMLHDVLAGTVVETVGSDSDGGGAVGHPDDGAME